MSLNRRPGQIFLDGFLPLALGWGRYSPGQRLDVLLALSSDEVAKDIIFNLRRPRLLAALLTMSLPQLVQRESTIVLVLTGGKNARPEAKNLAVISLEEIIRVNPQVIIGSSGNRSFEAIRKIKDSPEWARIDAVKNPRIYANPMGTFPWDRHSTEAALQILRAAQLFHPENSRTSTW